VVGSSRSSATAELRRDHTAPRRDGGRRAGEGEEGGHCRRGWFTTELRGLPCHGRAAAGAWVTRRSRKKGMRGGGEDVRTDLTARLSVRTRAEATSNKKTSRKGKQAKRGKEITESRRWVEQENKKEG
jgi:hypothetical protein